MWIHNHNESVYFFCWNAVRLSHGAQKSSIALQKCSEMLYKATIVEFDTKDEELIKKLQLENLESYRWHSACAMSGLRVVRHHSDDTLRILQEIEDFLKPGVSPYVRANRPNQRIYKSDVWNFWTQPEIVCASNWFIAMVLIPMQWEWWWSWIFCAHAQTYVLLFVPKFCFYKFHLSIKSIIAFGSRYIHRTCISYTEHFELQSYPAKLLTLFHKGFEFVHQNDRISMVCMFGYGRKAKVYAILVVNF